MRDQVVYVDATLHIPVDDFRDVGASTRPTECRAAPAASSDQLERPRGDFLTRTGDTDNTALTPALVGTLQSLTHDLHIADTFEAVVDSAAGHGNKVLHHVVHIAWVDEVCHAELTTQGFLRRIHVDADNTGGTHHACTLHHIQANATQPENGNRCTDLDTHGERDGSDARGDAAADVADLVEGGILTHLCQGNLGKNRVIGKGGAAHVVSQRPAIEGKT